MNCYCMKCGHPNHVGSNFCNKCGAAFGKIDTPKADEGVIGIVEARSKSKKKSTASVNVIDNASFVAEGKEDDEDDEVDGKSLDYLPEGKFEVESIETDTVQAITLGSILKKA